MDKRILDSLASHTIVKDIALLPEEWGFTSDEQAINGIFSYMISECMMDESGVLNDDFAMYRQLAIEAFSTSTNASNELAKFHSSSTKYKKLWRYLAHVACLKVGMSLAMSVDTKIIWKSDLSVSCHWVTELHRESEALIRIEYDSTHKPKTGMITYLPSHMEFPFSMSKCKNQSMMLVPYSLVHFLFLKDARNVGAPILSTCLVILHSIVASTGYTNPMLVHEQTQQITFQIPLFIDRTRDQVVESVVRLTPVWNADMRQIESMHWSLYALPSHSASLYTLPLIEMIRNVQMMPLDSSLSAQLQGTMIFDMTDMTTLLECNRAQVRVNMSSVFSILYIDHFIKNARQIGQTAESFVKSLTDECVIDLQVVSTHLGSSSPVSDDVRPSSPLSVESSDVDLPPIEEMDKYV